MTRVFLVRRPMPPPFKAHVEPWEVIAYDKATHHLSFRRPDGSTGVDPNFHIDIAKRCGYSLTAEVPPEFQEKRQ